MKKTITINPVTRIEGHARITIQMNDEGTVDDAVFHVTQFRGFEKFVEGRPFQEMPGITARTCGICPVSHLLAASKAGDAILAVRLPPNADRLRRLLHCGQMIQSHALSLFHLCSPDLLLGMDAPVAERHVLGVAAKHPEVVKDGIRLRQIGQRIIERLAGKRVHPAWTVPGGVSKPLSAETRDEILAELPEALDIARRAYDLYRGIVANFTREIETFANFPTLFLGLATRDGGLEHYDGVVRVVDADRKPVADHLDPARYDDYIGERTENFSYLKSPFYKPFGIDKGCYRVGPMARLNVAERCGTPVADALLAEFRKLAPGPGAVLSSFHYHQARLVEIVFCIESALQILRHPDILDPKVRAIAGTNAREGVGVVEAPRGILIHHYKVDDNGLVTWANLIVATGHNNLAINRGITQSAKYFVKGDRLTEGALNRVEAVVRCYDPCLSCSTHAVGQMAMRVELRDRNGNLLDERQRD